MASFDLKEFQQCTVDWILSQIKRRRDVKRFLIADEVGLGKTIISKHVIKGIKPSGNNVVAYISSSLDIGKQNRDKLCDDPSTEVVTNDRISLLYENGGLEDGLQILALTPGTSLSFRAGLGSVRERAYMAKFAIKYFRIDFESACRMFHGYAKYRNFRKYLEHYLDNKAIKLPPAHICQSLKVAWKDITLKSGERFKDIFNQSYIKKEQRRPMLREMRREMAKTFLSTLNPDIIVLDEFQNYRWMTETNDNGEIKDEISRLLLKKNTPTLLLSATPYRLFAGHHSGKNLTDGTGHLQDLKKTFGFLMADKVAADNIVADLFKYSEKTKKISADSVEEILEYKAEIEKNVMQYMTRTERVNFENNSESVVDNKFLSNGPDTVDWQNILEFFLLSPHAPSPRTVLTYWKSGAFPMSYMDKYKQMDSAVDNALRKGKSLEKMKPLFTSLKITDRSHVKLDYLYKDVLNSGSSFDYLWLPPTKPYYKGQGIYEESVLADNPVKKGLLFSSWRFVPRFVSAEICADKELKLKKSNKTQNPLKATTVNWAKFYWPSPLLTESLTHMDFVNIEKYEDIFDLAKSRITERLSKLGYRISSDKDSCNTTWMLLTHLELQNDPNTRSKIKKLYRKKGYRKNGKEDLGQPVAEEELERIMADNELSAVTPELIDELTEIAILSPAVCLMRSIQEVTNTKLSPHSWIQLADFCVRNLKNYFNRNSTTTVINKVYKGKVTYSDKVQRYLKAGNIQSVLDEYIFLCNPSKTDEGIEELIKRLNIVFGPKRGKIKIKTHKKIETITTDIVCPFGEGDEESDSRETVREAFNSPFWPFILATTTVGQEGLDFHLYCKDIYHWNLPTNPVDFEQREGRINRYNNLMIRKNALETNPNIKVKENEFLWSSVFDGVTEYTHRNDRYNLEMSPHWIFTPAKETEAIKISRHILDIPASNDLKRYEKLKKDVSNYRLALGQPNEANFLKELAENEYLLKNNVDVRGITLCFFPIKQRNYMNRARTIAANQHLTRLLIKDCCEYLKQIEKHAIHNELKPHVKRHIQIVESNSDKKQHLKSIQALLYFVDPHDDVSDRQPDVGLRDDLAVLKAA